MKSKQNLLQFIRCSLISLGFILLGCGPLNTSNYPSSNYPPPSYPSGGYGNPNYGGNSNDDYYAKREQERLRDERQRLHNERLHLENERKRLELQNAHHNPSPVAKEHCPSGFHETDRKCTDKERKKGCKDIKMKNGLRCLNKW